MSRLVELALLVLVVVVGAMWLHERGQLQAADAVWQIRYDSMSAKAAHRDTVYQYRRDTLWRRVAVFDTIVDSVDRWKHDTVKVVEYVQQARENLEACQSLVLDCEDRVLDRDRQLEQWRQRWEQRPRPPSQTRRTLETVGSGVLGWLARGWLGG